MSDERTMEIDTVSLEEERDGPSENEKQMDVEIKGKSAAEHVEYSSQPVLRKYVYWDTKDVVGADRHLGAESDFNTQDELFV
jgi:hypothetical protein